jgi:hypothetical protein
MLQGAPRGRKAMKREVGLIRQILLDLEEKGAYTNWMDIDNQEYSPEQMDYHLTLLTEGGLIQVEASERGRLRSLPVRLTWEGHEFLDAARDDRRWDKLMESLQEVGGVPFGILKDILLEMARQEMEEQVSIAQ